MDHVVANLETPLTSLIESPLKKRKKYLHRGNRDLTAATLWRHNIRHLSLANNHTLDYGYEGLQQTIEALDAHSIDHFGAGKNDEAAGQALTIKSGSRTDEPDIITIAGFTYRPSYRNDYDFYATESKPGVKLWSNENIGALVRQLRKANPTAFIVAYPHWGENYRWKNRAQTELAHQIIDAGADLILGHGAHRIQEIEQYNGRWIIYSLGNFMFLSPGRYQAYEVSPYSLIARLDMADNQRRLRLYPIFTDNRITNYQPRFVTKREFLAVRDELLNRSIDAKALGKLITFGADQYAHFLALRLN